MDGKLNPRAFKRVAVGMGALALLAGTGVGNAEDQQVGLSAPADAAVAAARPAVAFTPSAEARFENAFAAFDTPVEPALPAHAVDITTIEPAEPEATSLGTGVASYYGRRFHGRRTANGESFDMHAMTAAHRTLPFGSRVRVTNPRNGQSVVVRINDRGPFAGNRTIDLSRAAAEEIGLIHRGHGSVELELLTD